MDTMKLFGKDLFGGVSSFKNNSVSPFHSNKSLSSSDSSQATSTENDAVKVFLSQESLSLSYSQTSASASTSPASSITDFISGKTLSTLGDKDDPLQAFQDSTDYSILIAMIESLSNDDDRMANFVKGLEDMMAAFNSAYSQGAPQQTQQATPTDGSGTPQSGTSAMMIGQTISFSFSGSIQAVYAASENGEVSIQMVSLDMSVQMQQTTVQAQSANKSDPLTLDLNGDGQVSLSGPQDGIQFDITGDGQTEQTSFVKGADGFLALDLNKNGTIDNGTELFGDQNGAANGFLELAKYDENQDGKIDSQDSVFADLMVVQRNADNTLKLSSIEDLGIKEFSLANKNTSKGFAAYTGVTQTGSFTRENGQQGLLADVILKYA